MGPTRSVLLVVFFVSLIVVFSHFNNLMSQDTFQGLGDLSGGNTYSRANGVSGDGSVVTGHSPSPLGIVEAYRWSEANGMVGLGDLNGGGFSSDGWEVSANGSTIVGRGTSANGFEAMRWTAADGMQGLGDLAGGSFESLARGVSGDGSVIVGYGTGPNGWEAFRWSSGGGMQGLGATGGRESVANSVSSDGSVVAGNLISPNGDNEAFHWTSEQRFSGLGVLPGGTFGSSANSISADGTTIVGWSSSFNGIQAFRWESTYGMVTLGGLPGSLPTSRAHSVSGDGSIIVGDASTYGGNVPFIWDPQQGMRNLVDVLNDDFGLDLTGWELTDATAISVDGLTIVGNGRNPNGVFDSWRASVDARWIDGSSGQWDDRSNWAFGIRPNEMHDIMITPASGLTVHGSAFTSTIKSLELAAQSGIATLEVGDGTLNVLGQTNIGVSGRLAGSGTFNSASIINSGAMDLDQLQVNTAVLINHGRVSGNGFIAASMANQVTGEVRADTGDALDFAGPIFLNGGVLRAIGGEIRIRGAFQNAVDTGLIVGRNATYQFDVGVDNRGSMGFSFGTSDVFGDITNRDTGIINISGGANVTFYDDLDQNGTFQVVRVGNAVSTAVLFGEFSGAGGFTGGGNVFALGDLRPGNSPASILMDGNLYLGASTESLFELGGMGPGEFDQLLVTGELSLAGNLDVETIDGFRLTFNDEFLIAKVGNGLSGQFLGLDEGDLVGNLDGIDLFISYRAGDGNDVLLFSAVPEPSYSMLGLVLAGLVVTRRRFRRREDSSAFGDRH